MKTVRTLLCLTAGLAATACATAPDSPPLNVFTPMAQTCTAAPEAGYAETLQSRRPTGSYMQTTELDQDSPCLTLSDGTTPYAIFVLPEVDNLVSISAGGMYEPARMLAPTVTTYSANMQPVRRVHPDSFSQRGFGYAALFRPREDERYVVITADRNLVALKATTVDALPEIYQDASAYSVALRNEQAEFFSMAGTAYVRAFYSDPDAQGE